MNFKEWIKLDEVVKLIHQHKQFQDTEVVYLGKFGRFKTYYLYKKDGENRSDKALEAIKYCSEKANYGLSALGFPSNKINTLIIEFDVKSTNGPVIDSYAGYASGHGHGIVGILEHMSPNVLVHEYAHAYFFNMPRVAKNLFINKYSEYLKDFKYSFVGFASIQARLRRNFFEKIKQQNLAGFLIKELYSRYGYGRDINDTNFIDFIALPENANDIIKLLDDKLSEWYFYNGIPESDEQEYTYAYSPVRDEDRIDYYLSHLISGDKIYDFMIKNYKYYKRINQHDGGLSTYINEKLFWDLLISGDISRDVLKYYTSDSLGHFDDVGREAMAKRFNLPRSYSATNYHELWATVVEDAAINLKSINPELKKLLIQTIMMSR